jgi:hypothetical protein
MHFNVVHKVVNPKILQIFIMCAIYYVCDIKDAF